MGKKQQPSPPSETFVAADQLPAAEILAGELVSVVARNVESGRLSEHAISQAWATALARLGLAAAADGASGGSTTLVTGSSSRQAASLQEIFDELVGILGGDRPLLIIPAILGNNNHGGITSVAQMALSNIGEKLMEKASLGAGKKGNPFQTIGPANRADNSEYLLPLNKVVDGDLTMKMEQHQFPDKLLEDWLEKPAIFWLGYQKMGI